MKRIIAGIIALTCVSVSWADHLTGINADNLTRGTVPNSRLDPSSVTLQGNTINLSVLNSQVTSIAAANSESTMTFTLFGGGVFLSSSSPTGSATYRISKATWTIVGVDAFINKPSTVGATSFTLYHSSAAGAGITWAKITPQVHVTTEARQSIYISTSITLNETEWVGVGIDTVAISGLQAEDWGFNLYVFQTRKGQSW